MLIKYLITNSGPPKLVRCDVLVKKESRKFQYSENFQQGDCSLGIKELFCKISRNYIHKQRNSAELKKIFAQRRAIMWSALSRSASKFQTVEYSRRFFSLFTYLFGNCFKFYCLNIKMNLFSQIWLVFRIIIYTL